MSRILLLLVLLLWMTGTSDATFRPPEPVWLAATLFLGFYGLLVGLMGVWGRSVARRVASNGFGRTLRRFNQGMLIARFLVPGWFAVGMFALGWGWVIEEKLRLGYLGSVRLPALVLGTLPAVLAWVGLWWSQYPAERTVREQHVWEQLEEGTPLHAAPTFREYFLSNLRLQVLFTLVPVMMIVGVRDVAAVTVLDHPGVVAAGSPDASQYPSAADEAAEFVTFLVAFALVYLFAPEVLRRVLKTSPLPDGPLRRRLEALCRRTGMRYRDILVWHTHFNMGNAAVMGVVPWMRYVLLSDLLLERMDDEQIEAVFAHEVGHVVHRHMAWYVVFFLILVFGSAGPAVVAKAWLDQLGWSQQVMAPLLVLIGAAGVWTLFGFLSRRFERQADVYAARVIESVHGGAPPAAPYAAAYAPLATSAAAPAVRAADAPTSFVGRYGATLFASALHRVAVINNIPISPRARRDGNLLQRVGYLVGSFMDLAHDWLHGSIPSRMAYLQRLATDPRHTNRFDRVMVRLYCILLFALFASAAWTWMAVARG